MTITKQQILIKKKQQLLVEPTATTSISKSHCGILQAELMQLGFIVNDPGLLELNTFQIEKLHKESLSVLKQLVGADVSYTPFYPNFPKQVIEASELELFINAIVHYWSYGEWCPEYAKLDRLPYDEYSKYKPLTLGTEEDLCRVFTEILGSNASISTYDKEVLAFFLKNYYGDALVKYLPETIPFKENLCVFVKECLENGHSMVGMESLKTATDILRVATYLSGGDVSLAENTKFKSFKRQLRRSFVARLNKVINPDDIFRHGGKWIRLAHSLHIGEYKKSAPKAYKIISNLRDKSYKHRGYYSQVEAAFLAKDHEKLLSLLKSRPGEFARKLDHVLRSFPGYAGERYVNVFAVEVAGKIDTRVLLQLLGHFRNRRRTFQTEKRVVFPKGNIAKAQLVKKSLPEIPALAASNIVATIKSVLTARFAKLQPLAGRVYVDPALKDCPIPLSMRSASEGLCTVARGTQIPFDSDKNTIRLFIYWKGLDIDLSASLCNAEFVTARHVSFTNLKVANGLLAAHSGDIVNARNGAAEFIDIDIKKALKLNIKYIVMQVYVFNGPNFADHEICYAGWMFRDKPQSGEIFEPKSVQQKLDVVSNSRTCIPAVFDLEARKVIWMDLTCKQSWLDTSWGSVRSNTLETNRATIKDLLEASVSLENKPTLYDLFQLHTQARGEIVLDRTEADVVYSWNGDVKPTDIGVILSEYLK